MSAAVNMRTCKTRAEHGGPYGNNFRLFAAIRNPSFDGVKRHQSRAETQTAPTGRSAHESHTRLLSLHTGYFNTPRDISVKLMYNLYK